jgi:hypothetical protein
MVAKGLPNRVTKTGFRVLRTRSNTAQQVALNLEMVTFSIRHLYRAQRPWSKLSGT